MLVLVAFLGGLTLGQSLHNLMTEPELAYYFQTSDFNKIPEYEVAYLPPINSDFHSFDYNFTIFQKPISLNLHKNSIVAPNFKTYVLDEDSIVELSGGSPQDCHFLHKDAFTVAALSACDPKSTQGLVFLEDATLEIHPLTPRLQTLLSVTEALVDGGEDLTPYLVKRATFNSTPDNFPIHYFPDIPYLRDTNSIKAVNGLTLELAMFFDEAAYQIFAPYFDHDGRKLQNMLLAYLNGVQALYHHPSLGTTLELVLVRLDIMKRQPSAMPHYDGERSKLLESFCAYQNKINSKSDEDADHWDMALYISGLDFYAYENGKRSGVTMGLATVGGVCLDKYACVIAELGTTNILGKPYPSAGFTSVYILAHEIGHNLGMHHDSLGNTCPKEGFVMSPSRGTNGETQWSTCSAEIMTKLGWAKCLQDKPKSPRKSLDHSRFLDNPGLMYTAKKQCELLLRDKDAIMAPNQDPSSICHSLQCKTPNRSGFYFAGPALMGTQCGQGRYCYGGECVMKALPVPTKVVPGGWSPWKSEPCTSGCLEKSLGFQMKKRKCNNPPPINTDQGCEGSSFDFSTCRDDKICKGKRLAAVDYASQKCREFAKLLSDLDPKGVGLQAPHEEGRVWMGCAIFCRRADSNGFYTPKMELNDLGASPYFPDGTWCHRHKNLNYYCLHHHCLPENFHFTKLGLVEDMPFSQNARPSLQVPPQIKPYFSLGSDGKPLNIKVNPPLDEDDWETDDYITIPGLEDI